MEGSKNMIYADNAATTRLDEDAFESMKPFLLGEYGNASEPYSFSYKVKKAIKSSREIIASCINASPEEIYFTSGGTEGDNWAIKGTIAPNDHRKVITSAFEHHAILNSCAYIEKMGYPVQYLYPNEAGFITVESLEKCIDKDTRLVSVMLVNNEIGTIQPVKELASIAHKNGALFHTDAVQALGHIEIDVKDLGIDLLASSAHKYNGPKGIGFMYIRKGTKIFPYANGGEQEFGMRAGTENAASIVGMAVALEKNCKYLIQNQAKLKRLESTLLNMLDSFGIDYRRNGTAPQNPGNINLSFRGFEGEMLLHRLDLKGICVSTGSACDSKNTQISHVLKAINVPEEYALGTIRISLGKDNTDQDVIDIANAIKSILQDR